MSNIKKVIGGLIFLWKSRKHLSQLQTEIKDVWVVSRKVLKDKKVTKEETVQVLQELDDVIPVILQILGG